MNLLDNWDFTNPVNQRGKTSYSTGSNIANYKYTIDKWQLMNGSIRVNEKSIRFTTSNDIAVSEIYQQLEPLLFDNIRGKTVTFSIMINNKLYYCTDSIPLTGSVYTSQSEITGSNGGKFFLDLTYDSTGSSAIYAMFRLFSTARNSYVDIQAVKLEIGSASTLKNDALGVSYAEELRKCQRYYQRFNNTLNTQHNTLGIAEIHNNNKAYLPLNLVVPMRKKPVILFNNVAVQTCKDNVVCGVTSILNYDDYIKEAGIMKVELSSDTGFNSTENSVGLVNFSTGGYIELSADL